MYEATGISVMKQDSEWIEGVQSMFGMEFERETL